MVRANKSLERKHAWPGRLAKYAQEHVKVVLPGALGLVATFTGALYLLIERCSENDRYPEEFGSDSICRAPLVRFCGKVPSADEAAERVPCPDLGTELDSVEDWVDKDGSLMEAAAGKCRELSWVKWSTYFSGRTSFFDASGTLIGVDTWTDAYHLCARKSSQMAAVWHYGVVPTCMRETTIVIKAAPAPNAFPPAQ